MTDNSSGIGKRQLLERADIALNEVRELLEKSDRHLRGHDKRLNQALAATYSCGNQLIEAGLVQEYVVSHGRSWGKVAEKNPFQPLVQIYFAVSTEAPSTSRFAQGLAYARGSGVPEAEFLDWLAETGGIFKAADAYGSSSVGSSEYKEKPSVRLERALGTLRTSTVGAAQAVSSLDVPELMDNPDHEGLINLRKALVDIGGNMVRVIKILPSTGADLAHEVAGVVAPAGIRVGPDLRAKPLWDLWRVSSLYLELRQETKPKAEPIANLSVPEDEADYEAWADSVSARKVEPLWKPPDVLQGIHLFYADGAWWSQSISTGLVFPSFRVQIRGLPDELDRTQQFCLNDRQAKRLAEGFLYPGDWTLSVRKSTHEPVDNQVVLDRFELIAGSPWRASFLAQQSSPLLTISHFDLDAAQRWQRSFAGITGMSLPKVFALRWEDDRLQLVPPSHAQRTDLARPYVHGFATCEESRQGWSDLNGRWLTRLDLDRIFAIGKQFGMPLELALLRGNEGICGISLAVEGGAVIIPLAVSLSGDYAETVRFIAGGLSNDKGEQP